MSTRQQLLAAFLLALLLAGVSYYVAFAPISVRYTELANLDRNWDRLSSLAVRHLRVYGGKDREFAAVRTVITSNAHPGDRLKLAAGLRIKGVQSTFEENDELGGPSLIVQREGGTLAPAEVNQILEAIQFSTDSRRPDDDLPRDIEISVLKAGDAEETEKVFQFVVAVSGQNDVPTVRFQGGTGKRLTDVSEVALTSREPIKLGELFSRVRAGDGDRYDFFTVDFGVLSGQLRVSGKGLPGGDFAGAPLAWSETLPYTDREEYFLDVAGKHVALQSRRYNRVSKLLMGKTSDLWGITYVPPQDGSEPDVLTIRTNDHGDGVGHAAAQSVQKISIRFEENPLEVANVPKPNQALPKRNMFMEVVRLEHRQGKDLLPIMEYALPDGATIDAKQNTLILKGSPEALIEMRGSVQQLDIPLRQLRVQSVSAADVERMLAELSENELSFERDEGAGSIAPSTGVVCSPDFEFGKQAWDTILGSLPAEKVSELQGLEGEPQDLASMDAWLPVAKPSDSEPEWSEPLEAHRPVRIKVQLTAHLLNAQSLVLLAHASTSERHPDQAESGAYRVTASGRSSLGEWFYIDSTCSKEARPPANEFVPAIRLFVRVDPV